MKKKTFCMALILGVTMLYGQVGINTANPQATLDVKKTNKGNTAEGLLIPSFTVTELATKDSDYGNNQNGTMVFITEGTGSSGKTAQINGSGYYYYDSPSHLWIPTGSKEPWISKGTGYGATLSTENIYQTGQIGIGSSTIDPSAQLDITASNRGLLVPRMSKNERSAIVSPANGLLIYNTTTNCFNYYITSTSRWQSLCGTYEPASFNIVSCAPPTGPSGTFTAGAALNSNNTYTIVVNVTEIGTYQIIANTSNGFSFNKSGVFSQTGTQTVVLDGQGIPVNGPQSTTVSLNFNGIAVNPDCVLPTVNVGGSSTNFNLNCSAATVNGTYSTSIALDGTNYIDVPVTSVSTPGTAVVETAMINGIKFSSGSINITSSTTSIRLFGQGVPSNPGTNVYSFTSPGGSSSCSVAITAKTSIGTFANPANRCTDILSSASSSTDGYYWIKDASGNKYKTYCDMSNGGWTLIRSLSERQILVVEQSYNQPIGNQPSRNLVTTQTGVFNEYAFSLPSAVVNNIGSTSTTKQYRFSIKEKGHNTVAGATAVQVENTTVAPINDVWVPNNYLNVEITDGNPATGNYGTRGNTSTGKLFGFNFGKPTSGDTFYQINNQNFTYLIPGLYSLSGDYTGIWGGVGYAGANTPANNLTYTSINGSQITFNKYDLNDTFGIWMSVEAQLNHHIGTCSNSTDDYGGASACAAGWANWRPHRFNQRPDSNYEGRILQYWAK
ncbi:fibrinogen-like YCDxxxxGGGW domain-containing protein [Chryseobacterium sp. StRB126]|uniref:fibrinogen-like YCDxxxxGGGW domain-containing protein n=1 Tax=Chryseobacterium sp. StRB126 TaxID=878220 RepID=UPI0011873429|nr:fibrinogen-like YCDxxxxGGGW domain-containing protein [Chryseobacterium sp. StRB126]